MVEATGGPLIAAPQSGLGSKSQDRSIESDELPLVVECESEQIGIRDLLVTYKSRQERTGGLFKRNLVSPELMPGVFDFSG